MTDQISNQCRALQQNVININDLDISDIKQYKSIFVYTHYVEDFFNRFFTYLGKDTILITHNSDNGIHPHHTTFLEGEKIKKWFCQNRETSHPKLFSLPIGLANSQWAHGNQALIKSVKEKNLVKDILVYKNFDITTNYHERQICNNITQQNGIVLDSNIPIPNYWENLARSCFVISPPGNGIDCHRIWEALYLHTIPVVKYHEAFSQFTHLPILFIDDWREVTREFLTSKLDMIYNFPSQIDELDIDFWANKIKS